MKKELEGARVKEWCCSESCNLMLAEVQAKQRRTSLQGDSGISWIDIDGVQLDRVWWFIRYGRWGARMNHWRRLIEDTGGDCLRGWVQVDGNGHSEDAGQNRVPPQMLFLDSWQSLNLSVVWSAEREWERVRLLWGVNFLKFLLSILLNI